jgi:hypothetical protein
MKTWGKDYLLVHPIFSPPPPKEYAWGKDYPLDMSNHWKKATMEGRAMVV